MNFCAIQVQSVINTLQSQALLGTPNGVLSGLTSPLNRQGFKLALAPNKDRPSSTSHRKVYTEDVNQYVIKTLRLLVHVVPFSIVHA